VSQAESAWVAYRSRINIKQRDAGAEKKHWTYIQEHFPDRWASYREYEACRSTATSLAEITLTDDVAAVSGLPKPQHAGFAASSAYHDNLNSGTMLEAWEHYANAHVVFNTPTLTNHTVYKSMLVIIKNIIQEHDEWAVIASPLGAES
jgi:hypothetical protein